jgi:uncharacterized membrane protein
MTCEDATTRTIGFEKNRLETLTDAIFAFSMTLLVTGLNIPQSLEELTTEHVYSLLINLSPAFGHFLIAFFIIAWFWTIHHVQFHKIRFVNRGLLWLNMVSMAAIVLFPFSTSLVADFPTHPLAEMVFQVNLMLAGVLFYCQYYYASKHELIDPAKHHIDDFLEQAETLLIPVLSFAAMALTLVRVPWTSLIYCLAPPIILLLHYRHAKKPAFHSGTEV